jgi:hypothetical protein
MDEVELLKALGDVWSDTTKIIESMHALRRKIAGLLADSQGDDDLAVIYGMVHSQIEAVMSSLRISQARIESTVMGAVAAAASELEEEDTAEEEDNGGGDSEAEAPAAGAESLDANATQPNQEGVAEAHI